MKIIFTSIHIVLHQSPPQEKKKDPNLPDKLVTSELLDLGVTWNSIITRSFKASTLTKRTPGKSSIVYDRREVSNGRVEGRQSGCETEFYS